MNSRVLSKYSSAQHRDCTCIYRDRYVKSDDDVNDEQITGLRTAGEGVDGEGELPPTQAPCRRRCWFWPLFSKRGRSSFHTAALLLCGRRPPNLNPSISNDSHLHIHSTFLHSALSPQPLPNCYRWQSSFSDPEPSRRQVLEPNSQLHSHLAKWSRGR
jgi:hypothetical protein